jgi:uncharacterized protein (TIGR03435 family)
VQRSEFVAGARPFRGAGPLSEFLRAAQNHVDRRLVDGTGLAGNFEWETRFRAPLSQGDAPVFFDAVQNDFGLRFEARRGP